MKKYQDQQFAFRSFQAGWMVVFLLISSIIMGLTGVLSADRDWRQEEGYRWATLKGFDQEEVALGFTRLSSEQTSITFTNHLFYETHTTNQIFLNGSGVAAGDVDGDGLCDLYFCRLDGDNALYHNKGNWQFDEVAALAGVSCSGMPSTGAALVDLDGDADLDLVVNTLGQGTHIFVNDGTGHFKPMELMAELNPKRGGMSLAFADVDGDTDIDLYIANYRVDTIRDQLTVQFEARMENGKPELVSVNGLPITLEQFEGRFVMEPNGKVIEQGEADLFLLNQGAKGFQAIPFDKGAFIDGTGASLKKPPYDWGLSVMFRDFNGDLSPDLMLCNDFDSPDRMWFNINSQRFMAIRTGGFKTMSYFSMGVDVADVNRDGFDDMVTVDMMSETHLRRMMHSTEHYLRGNPPQYSRNMLYWNRADGTFAEVGRYAGIEATDWSWCPIFLDVDLDGYEDLVVTTGHEVYSLDADASASVESMRQQAQGRLSVLDQLKLNRHLPRLSLPNKVFRNRGDFTFEDMTDPWGFSESTVSHGMAMGDLDGDGDMDLAINNMNQEASILRNNGAGGRIAVRLKGAGKNTSGIGAKIKVHGGGMVQSQEMIAGGRYLSSDEPVRVFAFQEDWQEVWIEVLWRDKRRSVVKNVQPNRLYEIDESVSEVYSGVWAEVSESEENRPALRALPFQQPKRLFEDVSALVEHRHDEDFFDDFDRQPLLPRRLSQSGPGVSWLDFDGNGWDDLLVASGKGGKLSALLNNGKGGFDLFEGPPFSHDVTRDQTTILGIPLENRGFHLMVGVSNYEDGMWAGPAVMWMDGATQTVNTGRISSDQSSTGPLAAGDYDLDGDLDLFVGGRVKPGRYPEAASSMLFRWGDSGWEKDLENSKLLENLGLVSGAVWSDVNGDGKPELITAMEWDSIRVFAFVQGTIREITATLKLDGYTGWWNGVTAGDFNGDGRMDLVASNWGWNHDDYHGTNSVVLFYGDLAGRQQVDLVEAFTDEEQKKLVPVRSRRAMLEQSPFLQPRIPTHRAYGSVSVSELVGDSFASLKGMRVKTFAATVFWNRGNHFEAQPLPLEAQLAPSFGIAVGDANGDGNEDIFLALNFRATHAEIAYSDAGQGLWVLGDGNENWNPLLSQQSGVRIDGDQRGCALSDFNRDGKVDLAVGQNQGPVRLFRNIGAKQGLRIRAHAGPGNPSGVGAVMRLYFGEKPGPAREIHAGSGYWSQESVTQVMGVPDVATRIWVRWPGGKATFTPIPLGAKEIQVLSSGKINVVP